MSAKLLKTLMTTESKTNESPSKICNLQEEVKLFSGLKLISSTKLFEKFLDICYCNDSRVSYLLLLIIIPQ